MALRDPRRLLLTIRPQSLATRTFCPSTSNPILPRYPPPHAPPLRNDAHTDLPQHTHRCPCKIYIFCVCCSSGGGLDPFRQLNGYAHSVPEPLARAPDNVFVFRGKKQEVLGWRNVFELPIQYDVELCPGLLSADSPTLSYRFLPDGGPRRRFIVIGTHTLTLRHLSVARRCRIFLCDALL